MDRVIQQERTGCGIASVAAIARITYPEAKAAAHSLGIQASDRRLWSDTAYARRLLSHFSLATAPGETPFRSWSELPDLALLAIRWHLLDDGRPGWHWVVFVREGQQAYVLDSKKRLRSQRRTDFWRMTPKWFIPVIDS